jgi:SAM-dependent methyltransferase
MEYPEAYMPMSDLPHSPASDRNKEPILARLRGILGECGIALEIASGTGQHAVWFAASLTGWIWQPSDADPRLLPVIAERIARSGLGNVLPPKQLDVTTLRWPPFPQKFDAIFCANMLHIAPWKACLALMSGAARLLTPAGILITYGPYFQRGVPAAPTNLAFDKSLRARDSSWGIRDLEAVVAVARRNGLVLTQRHAMPANNLLLVFMAA